jgi:virulence factor Mce-like protein
MPKKPSRALAILAALTLAMSSCAFQGLNSLPLPGAVGRGASAATYTVDIANVGTLEPNSPVLMSDVVVGSIDSMHVEQWHAVVKLSVKPHIIVPANVVATVGQTSLLGSMHISLDPPIGQTPQGYLPPGARIPLTASSTYPSTEQTLSALAAVANGGGLGQIGDIVHNSAVALGGRGGQVRDLITRLDDLVGILSAQRDDIVSTISSLNTFAAALAGQRDTIERALRTIPPALEVLTSERPRITAALTTLGLFSDIATRLVNDSQDDMVKNLENLEPTLKSLADIGPDLDFLLAFATTYPYNQSFIDRAVRGDYMNLWVIFDLTVPRLKRGVLLGTRWGQEHAPLVPAPGDPWYEMQGLDPLKAPLAAPGQVPAAPPGLVPALPTPAGDGGADAASQTPSSAVSAGLPSPNQGGN